jgi:hypothetical protein
MPQLKQPMRLEEMGIRLHINKYCGKCEKWMQELREAIPRVMKTCEVVSRECREMEEEISKLPPWILKLLSPTLAKKFVKLICTYDYDFRCSEPQVWAAQRHVSLYKAVFRSVLTRFVEKFDTSLVKDKLVQVLMVENLKFVPGLLDLYLYPYVDDQSRRLTDMIHHLQNLRIFTYRSYCTDEIIAELQRHCPHLTKLDFAYSRKVTNASVEPLREARKLKFLNLTETQIDDEHYGLLLSELPNIANITFLENEASLLRHISVERLYTIYDVSGTIRDISTITQKCPNTTNINMIKFTPDLSGLIAFNTLRSLEIHSIDYRRSNFNAVLQSIGHRLTDLKLRVGDGVDPQDIITLCPSLINLSLIGCSILDLNSNTPLVPQLPHFRNLINLEIHLPVLCTNVGKFIRYYVNLKTIHLVRTCSLTVEFVKEIINLGTYKQLEILRVDEHSGGYISVNALELLIRHCPLLKRIETVGWCWHFHGDVLCEFKRLIVLENFDLKFKQMDKQTCYIQRDFS